MSSRTNWEVLDVKTHLRPRRQGHSSLLASGFRIVVGEATIDDGSRTQVDDRVHIAAWFAIRQQADGTVRLLAKPLA